MDLEKKAVQKIFLLGKSMKKNVMASPVGMNIGTKHRSKNEYISCGGSPSILPKQKV